MTVAQIKLILAKIRAKISKRKGKHKPTRADQIREASVVTVGGSEDEAKERVRRLFRKTNDVDYSKMDSEALAHIDEQYKVDKARFKELLAKESDSVFGDGEELTKHEVVELALLEENLGHLINMEDSILIGHERRKKILSELPNGI